MYNNNLKHSWVVCSILETMTRIKLINISRNTLTQAASSIFIQAEKSSLKTLVFLHNAKHQHRTAQLGQPASCQKCNRHVRLSNLVIEKK